MNREVRDYVGDRLVAAVRIHEKLERYGKIDDLEDETIALYEAKEYADRKEKDQVLKQVHEICHQIVVEEVRRLITVDKIRPDGRKVDESPSFKFPS